MPDYYVVPYLDMVGGMYYAVIFDCRVLADDYLAEIPSDYRPGPYTGIFSDLDIAHYIGGLADKGGLVDTRFFIFKTFYHWHFSQLFFT
jgi:hypothetical protein